MTLFFSSLQSNIVDTSFPNSDGCLGFCRWIWLCVWCVAAGGRRTGCCCVTAVTTATTPSASSLLCTTSPKETGGAQSVSPRYANVSKIKPHHHVAGWGVRCFVQGPSPTRFLFIFSFRNAANLTRRLALNRRTEIIPCVLSGKWLMRSNLITSTCRFTYVKGSFGSRGVSLLSPRVNF